MYQLLAIVQLEGLINSWLKPSYSNTTTILVLIDAVAIVQSKQLNGFSLCTLTTKNCCEQSFLQFVYKKVELSGHTNGSSALR